MTPVIQASRLVTRYAGVEALAALDLTVEAGEVVALLGPNGAGKTTFVRSAATLVRPDEGELRVLRLRPRARRIGFERSSASPGSMPQSRRR